MSGPAADFIEVSILNYSRRYQSTSSGHILARQIWGKAGLQDMEASPLDPNAEDAFQRIRPQIVTIIQRTPRPYDPAHLRGPRKSPIATVDGVRLFERDGPVEDGVDTVFIRCSSKPFAAELEKKILETGVLETVQTKFELYLHYGPPMWDWNARWSFEDEGALNKVREPSTNMNYSLGY
ncbi:hypothetical protein QBC40DRAFT_325317 [Triangularia verruculosa]|uniref:Uncharacterized protein n=1 Tax=Triangularia verruculosa TaxID=2587418 RepID=A0AAN6XHR6_9PEZI|nr:hypothetical protein QBC40DRAFT_325317 [Triangularia verruculosa]